MTVEVETQMAQNVVDDVVLPKEGVEDKQVVVVVDENNDDVKKVDEEGGEEEEEPKSVEKCSSYREESNSLSDLKEFERKALNDFKTKIEEAILEDTLFKTVEEEKKKSKKSTTPPPPKPAAPEENDKKEAKEGEEEECEKPEEGEKPETETKEEESAEEKCNVEVDKEISLWGVPLLPSKGVEETNVVLLKFLRAREFKVNDAFEMLKKTLLWRKNSNVDTILGEEFDSDLSSAGYLNGTDREGHPVCYNIYGVFGNEELYRKTFGTEEKREQFLRWRYQLMERGIKQLDLKPSGVSSLLQINDLKNSPGPAKKELRSAMKQAINLLQDNYPEFVARNILINVPFWYYALNALISPFLTQRTKSKFVVARPAKVTETLLKYIAAEEIPVQYGGFKRENDFEFTKEDGGVTEIAIKAGATKIIEIPAEEVGSTLVWDLSVLGWEVNYKEEFVPSDEGSYTIIVQKTKKMGSNEGPVRNSFRNNEPGKVCLTIQNVSTKKKRILYRHKTKECSE